MFKKHSRSTEIQGDEIVYGQRDQIQEMVRCQHQLMDAQFELSRIKHEKALEEHEKAREKEQDINNMKKDIRNLLNEYGWIDFAVYAWSITKMKMLRFRKEQKMGRNAYGFEVNTHFYELAKSKMLNKYNIEIAQFKQMTIGV